MHAFKLYASRIVLALAALATFPAGGPSRAHALSCAELSSPRRGEAVPRNARVWIPGGRSDATYRISDSQQRVVPHVLTRIPLGQRALHVLVPSALLEYPGTYNVEACVVGLDGVERCSAITDFVTTDQIDTEPPGPFDASGARGAYENDDDWGDTRLVTYPLPPGTLAVVDVDGAGASSPFAMGAHLGDFSAGDGVAVGRAPCSPETFPGNAGDLRFGLLDLAGNFGGWSETMRVVLPTSPVGIANGDSNGSGDGSGDSNADGCRLASRADGGSTWLALMGALLLGRCRPRAAQPRSLRTNSKNARSAGG